MSKAITPTWVAVDWGTSTLRAYAMQGASVLARARSDEGMARLGPQEFEPALRRLIGDWIGAGPMTVVACGMIGARQGWAEAPYRAVPCAPLAGGLVRAAAGKDLSVHIVPGLSQVSPPDVMRGEETQIAGFLSLNPTWDGVLCLPGTHTKWVHLSAGEIISFQTFMTGELFALLSRSSVLRHSIPDEGWNAEAFDTAVSETISRPERLAARLFGLRAGDLLGKREGCTMRAALSGYLIGAELAASRPYWLGQNIAILGMDAQARAYRDALAPQGVPAMLVDMERATVAGLTTACRALKDTP